MRDVLDLGDAGQAAIMQMNVDANAAPIGDAEDDVEMSVDVAIVSCGIQPADQIRAGANASSSNSAVPGDVTMPLCGKATI